MFHQTHDSAAPSPWESAMDAASIKQAAERLVTARRTRQLLDGLPEGLSPPTSEAGFAIQDAVTALLGERAGGWKVGGSPNAPPACAPSCASLIRESPLRTA